MSRIGLHRPRRTRAASRRPAPDTRLLLSPSLFNTHYKRCPKAQRLDLRSDLSPPRPMNGRFPDKSRQALFKGSCQVSAPLIGRNGFAPSGDAQEHGVMLLHWATAPFSDSPGIHLAGGSEQSDNPRLKINAPSMDSTVVTTGEFPTTNAGLGSPLPSLRVVEHFRWSRLPQSENFSHLVNTLSEVWGKDSTVVTLGELPTTNAGHGSPLPIPQGGRALPVGENAPEREYLASRPYPIGSMGLSQSRRRCRPSPGADTPHRNRASPTSCTNRPGPSTPTPPTVPTLHTVIHAPRAGIHPRRRGRGEESYPLSLEGRGLG